MFWNRAVCAELLEGMGYAPMSRSLQIEQWTQLLEPCKRFAIDLRHP